MGPGGLKAGNGQEIIAVVQARKDWGKDQVIEMSHTGTELLVYITAYIKAQHCFY